MSALRNVHLAGADDDDDVYSGFNDYNALHTDELVNDETFQQAVARTSYGRRPQSSKLGTAVGGRSAMGRLATSSGARGRPAVTARPMTSSQPKTAARPMTAVRGVGYVSSGRTASYDPLKSGPAAKIEENPEEKCKQLEKKVNELLEESIMAYDRLDFKVALERAKEAGRKERAAVKLREQLNLMDQVNLDLTFNVLFNLAHQYVANEMYTEALNTYQVIVKNKMFSNAGRLRVNIGNIYFKKKDYEKAIKSYRMALDQVPNIQKETRIKIMNNIGVAFVRTGKYDEAVSTFDHCMDEKADFRTGLNLLLCVYTLDDKDKMKETFQRLVEVPLEADDDEKYLSHSNDPSENLVIEVIKNDSLRQWEKARRQDAERIILTAAKLISPAIASTFTDGYSWCVEMIKQSNYAELASDLEINKAIRHLRDQDLSAATEVLRSFEKKDSKVASAAANNLAFLYYLQQDYKQAELYADAALTNDRYNPNALVNKGNICYARGEYDKAREFYKEAFNNETSCVEALFNLGLTSKKMGKLEEALESFHKLHSILRNNAQVLYQIGSIYEMLEDVTQSIEWFTQANSMAPTDPAILAKLGEVYDREGDKSQAFQYHYDSYRFYPSNIDVIEWLGAYYIDAQFCEKAVNYFEKAALIQPHDVKWQLMIASCHRRSGNYHKALDTYKFVHKKFPDNIECLKFLVRLSTDMGLPEAPEYINKLKRAEKMRELRDQRNSAPARGSATGKKWLIFYRGESCVGTGIRSLVSQLENLGEDWFLVHYQSGGPAVIPGPCLYMMGDLSDRLIAENAGICRHLSGGGRPLSSRGSSRGTSGRVAFEKADGYKGQQQDYDVSYTDPLGPAPERPKTTMRRRQDDEDFEHEEIGDDLLPE